MKYNEVLILYSVESREIVLCNEIKRRLLKDRIAKRVFVRQCYRVVPELYNYKPDLVISPFPRDKYSTKMFTMIKIAFQCTWISMTTEGFGDLNEEQAELFIGFNKQPEKLVDYYCFWGTGYAELARPLLIRNHKLTSADRIKVFGYIMYEKGIYKHVPSYVNEFSITINNKRSSYKKIILFGAGLMMHSPGADEFIVSSMYKEVTEKTKIEMEERAKSLEYYQDGLVDIIRRMAERYPDYLVVLKLHPVDIDTVKQKSIKNTRIECLKAIPNVLIIDEVIPIASLWDYTDIYIHAGSTTGMEAYINHIPQIAIKNDYISSITGKVINETDVFIAQRVFGVSEIDEIIGLIGSDYEYEPDDVIAQEVYEFVSYKDGEQYNPLEKLLSIIDHADDGQKISIKDRYVLKSIISITCFHKFAIIVKKAMMDIGHGRITKAFTKIRWFFGFVVKAAKSITY